MDAELGTNCRYQYQGSGNPPPQATERKGSISLHRKELIASSGHVYPFFPEPQQGFPRWRNRPVTSEIICKLQVEGPSPS